MAESPDVDGSRLLDTWKRFQGIVRHVQELAFTLNSLFEEMNNLSGGGYLPGPYALPWRQTRALDRADKDALANHSTALESALSETLIVSIAKGLSPILASNIPSSIAPTLLLLRDVLEGFGNKLLRDAAEGSLEIRICKCYLELRPIAQRLTILEDAYSGNATLIRLIATQDPSKADLETRRQEGLDYWNSSDSVSWADVAERVHANRDMAASVKEEIKDFADKTGQRATMRIGKPGSKPKSLRK